MKNNNNSQRMSSAISFLIVCYCVVLAGTASADDKKPASGTKPFKRVVSLVPSATEIIYKLGAESVLAGITYHDDYFFKRAKPVVVGGFFEPDISMIEKANPDLILLSGIHEKVRAYFSTRSCRIMELRTQAFADSFRQILFFGMLFDKEQKAAEIVAENKNLLALIKKKINTIPKERRRRVIRLMGRDAIMTPGTDSFQNEMIRAAGGITHDFDQNGQIIRVSKENWIKFNPQVIYGCGGDRKTAESFFSQPEWREAEAVRSSRIFYYPCELTCRASTNTGYFVSWLAANIYADLFAKEAHCMTPNEVVRSHAVEIDLPFIKEARIVSSTIYDFINKTLILDFKEPLTVVSTLEGMRSNIRTAGNHYSPPQYWAVAHDNGLEGQRKIVLDVIGRKAVSSSFLFTGANMDHLTIEKSRHKDLTVYALVTAGVRSNAMRMSRDPGMFYEPGTINIIIMSNMQLTPRAMTRAIISATEAKTAALLDMDIRSSYQNGDYRATGTGTDNVLVAEGDGMPLKNAGGHTKLGELIAKAVYAGVRQSVLKQNRLTVSRNIFQRLRERDITIHSLIANETCDCGRDRNEFSGDVEAILLDPKYAGFLESALVISDDYEKGLIDDLSAYEDYALAIAEEIAGHPIDDVRPLVQSNDLPRVIHIALNMLSNGVCYKDSNQ